VVAWVLGEVVERGNEALRGIGFAFGGIKVL
jgi:hypothetical protein